MEYRENDHVIWDTDTYPSIAVLGERTKIDGVEGFIEKEDGEFISVNDLENARKATHSEIRRYYLNRNVTYF